MNERANLDEFTKAILVLVFAGIIFGVFPINGKLIKGHKQIRNRKIIDLSPNFGSCRQRKEIVNKFNTQVRKYAHFIAAPCIGLMLFSVIK